MRPKDTQPVGSEMKLRGLPSNSAVETLCPALQDYRPPDSQVARGCLSGFSPLLSVKHRRVAGVPVPAFLYYLCLPSAASRDLAPRPGVARKDKEPTPDLACVLPPVLERTMTKPCCSWPCAGSPTSSSSGKGDRPLVRLWQVRFAAFLHLSPPAVQRGPRGRCLLAQRAQGLMEPLLCTGLHTHGLEKSIQNFVELVLHIPSARWRN